jgi:hypothetical protein
LQLEDTFLTIKITAISTFNTKAVIFNITL